MVLQVASYAIMVYGAVACNAILSVECTVADKETNSTYHGNEKLSICKENVYLIHYT